MKYKNPGYRKWLPYLAWKTQPSLPTYRVSWHVSVGSEDLDSVRYLYCPTTPSGMRKSWVVILMLLLQHNWMGISALCWCIHTAFIPHACCHLSMTGIETWSFLTFAFSGWKQHETLWQGAHGRGSSRNNRAAQALVYWLQICLS